MNEAEHPSPHPGRLGDGHNDHVIVVSGTGQLPGVAPRDPGVPAAAMKERAEAERHRRRERLLAWRSVLQAGVVAVSPALLDMAAALGVDLHRGCGRLRPPTGWSGGFPLSWGGSWYEVWPHAPSPRGRSAPYDCARRVARVVRARAGPAARRDGDFVVAVDGCALSGCANVGDADFLTHGHRMRIWFGSALPETVLAASVGMRVDRLLSHPILIGRAYDIVAATREGGATVVEVETELLPFAMPWPSLASAVEREFDR